jgi:hypothetical protein
MPDEREYSSCKNRGPSYGSHEQNSPFLVNGSNNFLSKNEGHLWIPSPKIKFRGIFRKIAVCYLQDVSKKTLNTCIIGVHDYLQPKSAARISQLTLIIAIGVLRLCADCFCKLYLSESPIRNIRMGYFLERLVAKTAVSIPLRNAIRQLSAVTVLTEHIQHLIRSVPESCPLETKFPRNCQPLLGETEEILLVGHGGAQQSLYRRKMVAAVPLVPSILLGVTVSVMLRGCPLK